MFLHPFHIEFFVSTRKLNTKHSVFGRRVTVVKLRVSYITEKFIISKYKTNVLLCTFNISQGSIGVRYILLFNRTTTGVTSGTLSTELEKALNVTGNDTFIGPFQLLKMDGGNVLTFSGKNIC